jgi:AraC family transcriptional regulator, exoenzyme S synthesis regulatory protein ExsA
MINMQEFIEQSPFTKKIGVDELLFAEFKCPQDGKKTSIWWNDNFFAHVLTGTTVLKTPRGEYVLKAGESAFARKGSMIAHNHTYEDFCELLIFVPDDFIKTVAQKYKVPLPVDPVNDPVDTVIPLISDDILVSYFQSLLTHFVQPNPPASTLLKLKFEELLLNVLSNTIHSPVSRYFSEVCRTAKPSIRETMELNFSSNLSLDEFARLCARSLSAFKREFIQIYNASPGKWLMEKRLEYSYYLLETTDLSIDDICMECGFENRTHFIRVFKNRFGVTPGKQKMAKHSVVHQGTYA